MVYNKLRLRHAYSLVEVMVYMALFCIVLVSLSVFFRFFIKKEISLKRQMTKNIELERGYTKLMDVFEGIRILYGTEGRVSLFKFQGGDTFFGDFYFDNGVQAYPQYAGKIKGHFMFDYQTLYLVLDADKTIDKQAVDIKRVIFSDIERLEVAFEKNSTMYSQWDNIELFDYLHINIFFQEPYTENFRFVIPCHPLMVKGPIS